MIAASGTGGHLFPAIALAQQLPDYKIENDTVKRWLTAINSHDGSTSIGFGSANTVVICQNTFYKAFKEVEKFRHTLSAKQRVDAAKIHLMATLNSDNHLMEQYSRMADFKSAGHEKIFEKIVKNLFKVDASTVENKDVSTRKANQIDKFNNVVILI